MLLQLWLRLATVILRIKQPVQYNMEYNKGVWTLLVWWWYFEPLVPLFFVTETRHGCLDSIRSNQELLPDDHELRSSFSTLFHFDLLIEAGQRAGEGQEGAYGDLRGGIRNDCDDSCFWDYVNVWFCWYDLTVQYIRWIRFWEDHDLVRPKLQPPEVIGRDLKGGKAMDLTWSHFSCMSRMSQAFPKEAIGGIAVKQVLTGCQGMNLLRVCSSFLCVMSDCGRKMR